MANKKRPETSSTWAVFIQKEKLKKESDEAEMKLKAFKTGFDACNNIFKSFTSWI